MRYVCMLVSHILRRDIQIVEQDQTIIADNHCGFTARVLVIQSEITVANGVLML